MAEENDKDAVEEAGQERRESQRQAGKENESGKKNRTAEGIRVN